MTRARPLRFLALVAGLWIGARAVMLTLSVAPAPVVQVAGKVQTARTSPAPAIPAASPIEQMSAAYPSLIRAFPYKRILCGPERGAATIPVVAAVPSPSVPPPSMAPAALAKPAMTLALSPVATIPREPSPAPRWSASAWLLVRDGRGRAALAPGGTLGGSQAGGRLLYRIGGGLALSARAYAPLRRPAGAEAAAGIDWQPAAQLPLHLLAERRQDIGGAGRSAFALTLHGGASARLPGGLRGEAYAQAGVVGTRSRDLFVDASARVSVPVGPVEIGASAWGATQPGAARLDAGPHVSYRLPVADANIRLQADWRVRIAGDAAPGSGPALTIAADF